LIPRSFRGRPPRLPDNFTQQVISTVRFASLLSNPKIPTKICSRVWDPTLHKYYPDSFRKSCKEILLCSSAPEIQPPPKVAKEQINAAAHLPPTLWKEVISFTHRDWFEQPRSEESFLRQRLEEERRATAQAEEARVEAEERLRIMERERDAYRRLALRWQARLQGLLRNRPDNEAEDEDNDATLFMGHDNLNDIIRQFQEGADDSSDDEDTTQGEEAMDAEPSEGEDDDASIADMDAEEETMSTSDSESTMAASPPESSAPVFMRQARTVSIASREA